ncbi:Disks large 1 tumor suppressor protein [Paragonimus heterotremus]|uniref:Disks large 1 tumor suppressor protein n=1 Tax=Paragonimus heterotremus TaxID=100268 RepID=A0A8J4TQA0_9TREM|nr:Disks large 1 tumor suppressor protein [Paragonimus heterotremus]
MNVDTVGPAGVVPRPRFPRTTPQHFKPSAGSSFPTSSVLPSINCSTPGNVPSPSPQSTLGSNCAVPATLHSSANLRASSLESFNHAPCLTTTMKKTLTVRALFDYDPSSDIGLPCRGLAFQHGDILHVVNATDQEWWQARRLMLYGSGEFGARFPDASSMTSTLTTRSPLGVIPSRQRIERRQRARSKRVNFFAKVTVIGSNTTPQLCPNPNATLPPVNPINPMSSGVHRDSDPSPSPWLNGQDDVDSFPGLNSTLDRHRKSSASNGSERKTRSGSITRSLLKRFSNRNRPKGDCLPLSGLPNNLDTVSEGEPMDVIRSYEPVVPITINLARPLLIFGPLKERVIDALLQDPKFATCVPHTSRPPRPGEKDGIDYHFLPSKAKMEQEIKSDRFIEVGQYQDHYYATSIDSVRRTLQTGRVCVLDVNLTAIRRLELAGLYPISILLKPLSVLHLRSLQRRLTEDQAKRSVDLALRLESDNWRIFSAIISYDTMECAITAVKNYVLLHGGPVIWVASGIATRTTGELTGTGSQSSTLPRGPRFPVSSASGNK